MAESTWSCPCEMFSSVGAAAGAADAPAAARSAAMMASTEGCGRPTARRTAAGKEEMGSAEESTSASRWSRLRSSSPAAEAPRGPSSSPAPFAAPAESVPSELSPGCFDGDGLAARFRFRHLDRESGSGGERGGAGVRVLERCENSEAGMGVGRGAYLSWRRPCAASSPAARGGGGRGGGGGRNVSASEGDHGRLVRGT
jgi:hypothetical protein